MTQAVESISDHGSPLDPELSAELEAIRFLLADTPRFVLASVICNDIPLQRRSIAILQADVPDVTIVDLSNDRFENLAEIEKEMATASRGVFLTGIVNWWSKDSTCERRATLLNAARERWAARFAFPVLLWLNRTSADALAKWAPDLWRYRSHRFELVAKAPISFSERSMAIQTSDSGSYTGSLNRADTLSRIEELRGRLAQWRRLRQAPAGGIVNSGARPLGQAAIRWQLELSSHLSKLGQVRKALDASEEALEQAREIGDRVGEGTSLGYLGIAWAELGDARKAREFFEHQLQITREIGDRRGEGDSYGNLGIAWKNLGDARKAIGYYEQAIAIAHEIHDRHGEGNSIGNLGNAWAHLGEVHKAIGYYEQQFLIANEIGDRRGEGNALGNLGIAWATLGNAHRAVGYFERVLALFREIGDRQGEGSTLGNLGNVWAMAGDSRKAIECYEQNLGISREVGDRRGEGTALGNLGSAWASLDDAHKAIGFYDDALVVDREIGDIRGEAMDLLNSADELAKLGKRKEALMRAERAAEIYTAIESPDKEKARQRIATLRAAG